MFTEKERYVIPVSGDEALHQRPVIIGSGPAGLFAAYVLALSGYKPLILERGADALTRTSRVEHFWTTGELDTNTNVQFGEGGAGTFSDGKLNTSVKDPGYRRADPGLSAHEREAHRARSRVSLSLPGD